MLAGKLKCNRWEGNETCVTAANHNSLCCLLALVLSRYAVYNGLDLLTRAYHKTGSSINYGRGSELGGGQRFASGFNLG